MEQPALSEGHRLFLEVPLSNVEIAKAMGVSRMSVSRYRRGLKIPADDCKHKMLSLWGIPPDSWDRVPGGGTIPPPKVVAPPPAKPKPKPKKAKPKPKKPKPVSDSDFSVKPKKRGRPKKSPKEKGQMRGGTGPISPPATDVAALVSSTEDVPRELHPQMPEPCADPIEEFDRQVAFLLHRQRDPSVTDQAKVAYSNQIGRLLAQKATVSAKLETIETRFWKTPSARSLADALLSLVESYPQIEDELLRILEGRAA